MTDLKPENVLICIDDVESIIQSELANSATNGPAPTKLVGVPPSRGRGGNQTPRSESIFITGSQPLPSPSSSYGTSPMLDKWAFGMSKISADDESPSKGSSGKEDERRTTRADSTEQATQAIGKVSLDNSETPRLHLGEKTSASVVRPAPGPSLLTQQAPSNGQRAPEPSTTASTASDPLPLTDTPLSTSAMSVDALSRQSTLDSGSSESRTSLAEASERITVKIADLGNGEAPLPLLPPPPRPCMRCTEF